MRAPTRFRTMTEEELINAFADCREHSPVIEELCQRIEKVLDQGLDEVQQNLISCPVCEAELRVTADILNEQYVIDIVTG